MTATKKATPKNKGGRPTKVTEELTEKLFQYISEGNYLDTACRLAGVDYSTMRRWVQRGEKEGKGIYYDFGEMLKIAEAQAEAKRVSLILKAGEFDDWKANAWYLERKYPERWAKKTTLDANIKSEHVERQEMHIEHQLEADPETTELVRQLWRRQQALEG